MEPERCHQEETKEHPLPIPEEYMDAALHKCPIADGKAGLSTSASWKRIKAKAEDMVDDEDKEQLDILDRLPISADDKEALLRELTGHAFSSAKRKPDDEEHATVPSMQVKRAMVIPVRKDLLPAPWNRNRPRKNPKPSTPNPVRIGRQRF